MGIGLTIGYLKKTSDNGLQFYRSEDNRSELVAVTDAAFATDPKSRKSCSGYFIYYNNNLISAHSGTQSRVTTSAAEAEMTAIYASCKTLLTLRGLLEELNTTPRHIAILTDSSATVRTLHNPVSSRYKFLSIYIHFVKELVSRLNLQIYHLPREQNAADLLTKQSNRFEFDRLWNLAKPPFCWKHNKVDHRTKGGESQTNSHKNTSHKSTRSKTTETANIQRKRIQRERTKKFSTGTFRSTFGGSGLFKKSRTNY